MQPGCQYALMMEASADDCAIAPRTMAVETTSSSNADAGYCAHPGLQDRRSASTAHDVAGPASRHRAKRGGNCFLSQRLGDRSAGRRHLDKRHHTDLRLARRRGCTSMVGAKMLSVNSFRHLHARHAVAGEMAPDEGIAHQFIRMRIHVTALSTTHVHVELSHFLHDVGRIIHR